MRNLFAKCAKRSCHLFAQSLRCVVSIQLDLLVFSPSLNHQHVYRRNVLTELTARSHLVVCEKVVTQQYSTGPQPHGAV